MLFKDIKNQKSTAQKSKEAYEGTEEIEKGKYERDPIYSLSSKMRMSHAKDEEYIEQLKRSMYSKNTDYPKKVLDIDLDTGKVQIGYSEKDDKAAIVLEKKTALDQSANEAAERQVVESEASCIKEGSYQYISNDIKMQNGAVALKTDSKNDAGLVLNKMNKISSDKKSTTTIEKVLPFLNTEREKKELNALKKQENDINEGGFKAIEKDNSEKQNMYENSVKKSISKTNTIIVKKEAKKLELKNKLFRSLTEINDISHNNSQDDYYVYMRRKWLEMAAEEKKTEEADAQDEEAIEVENAIEEKTL